MKRDQVNLEDMEENSKEFERAVKHYLEEWKPLKRGLPRFKKRFDNDVERFMNEINTSNKLMKYAFSIVC